MRKEWFKMYPDELSRPELALIAKRLNVRRTAVQAAWMLARSMACETEPRGAFNPDERALEMIAFILDETLEDTTRIIASFSERGLVTDGAISDWAVTQDLKSNGAERIARYRAKKKEQQKRISNGQPVTCNAETVTDNGDTELEGREEQEEEKEPPLPPKGEWEGVVEPFKEFWKARPGRGLSVDNEQDAEREFRKLIDQGDATPSVLIAAMKAYAVVCRDTGKAGTQYAKATSGFLRDGIWKDFAKQAEQAQVAQTAAAAEIAEMPEWQQSLCRVLTPYQVRAWFKDAVLDGARIIFPKKFSRDFIVQHHEHTVRQCLGNVALEVRA